jgi:hypothetical protein
VLCKHTASAHIPVIAGYYSTIAGVMAGFAFISLFYLVTGYNKERNDSYHRATIALGAAFVSLLLVAVSYTMLAGEVESSGRAASIEVIVGVGFAVAAIQLIYAIALLIAAHGEDMPAKKFFQVLGGWLLCPLTFLLINLGTTDYVEARRHVARNVAQYLFTFPLDVAWMLLAVLLVGVATAWMRRGKGKPLPLQVDPSWSALAIGAGAVVGSAAVSVWLGPCATIPAGVLIGVQAIACLALINQARWLFTPLPSDGQPRIG